jgi:hypothetical protein
VVCIFPNWSIEEPDEEKEEENEAAVVVVPVGCEADREEEGIAALRAVYNE